MIVIPHLQSMDDYRKEWLKFSASNIVYSGQCRDVFEAIVFKSGQLPQWRTFI